MSFTLKNSVAEKKERDILKKLIFLKNWTTELLNLKYFRDYFLHYLVTLNGKIPPSCFFKKDNKAQRNWLYRCHSNVILEENL